MRGSGPQQRSCCCNRRLRKRRASRRSQNHWRSSGDKFVTGSDSELNGITADACCASPDKWSPASWLWRSYGRVMKRQLVFLEQPAGCSRQTQRKNSHAFTGHGASDWRCHMVKKNCIVLKSAVCRLLNFDLSHLHDRQHGRPL